MATREAIDLMPHQGWLSWAPGTGSLERRKLRSLEERPEVSTQGHQWECSQLTPGGWQVGGEWDWQLLNQEVGWLSEKAYNQLGTGFLISLWMQGHVRMWLKGLLVGEAWEADQVGNTSGLLETMWLPLLSDYRWSHPGISLDLALDPSQSESRPSPISMVSFSFCNVKS